MSGDPLEGTFLDRRRAQEPIDSRDTRASFSGDLSEVALVDLVQTLEMGRRTGTLRLTDRAGRSATVWLRDGRPVDCELGAAQGEAAFYRLLRWTEGAFAVEFEPVTRPARIASTDALVLEGLRRADVWRSAVAQLPDLGAVVQIDYRLLSERLAEIPDDMNALLRLVDGRRTLGQVLEEVGIDELAAAAMIGRLCVEQIVRVVAHCVEDGSEANTTAPATPEPERVTWFAGPGAGSAAPGAEAAPAAAAPGRTPLPAAPAPAAPAGEAHPLRIVRFPPRERGPAPTPRPGEATAVTPPATAMAPATPGGVAPARAVPRTTPSTSARGGRVLAAAVALIALVAGAAAWKRWRAEAAASGADDYEAQLGEARRLREAGRLPEAIAGYRSALATRDTSAAEAELGRTLSEADRPAAAIDAFRRAVELDAANAAAYIALGEACLGEQRLADARWAFERYLALEPKGDRADEARAALKRIDNCK